MAIERQTYTRFRVVCPECGHVGSARWSSRANEVKCRECGKQFPTHGNTYRPVTGGMTDEEVRQHRRDMQRAARARRRDHYRAKARERYAAWAMQATPEERERQAERVREYLHADPAREQANRERVRKWAKEHPERARERRRRWYAEHKHELKMRRVEAELRERKERECA